jgi:hypothetical protein
MLQVDFSKVILNYNDYVYDDADTWVNQLLKSARPYEKDDCTDLEELDDLENPE